ncbi:hypothetical protein NEOLEDRAFT_340823 [Neolentinus lepideus HHB14362 ss-1]|uniref:Uncharacterized protein n=1 Tax=Neolentinus lepideus HHB14362 ss-1 TaxID=1314782 RepID=A0A165SWU5_9AGAM|nr:hypothetical protein NEOLEDRAFT_340823 [Neolentinus lepideus HHB14362 ss-1]
MNPLLTRSKRWKWHSGRRSAERKAHNPQVCQHRALDASVSYSSKKSIRVRVPPAPITGHKSTDAAPPSRKKSAHTSHRHLPSVLLIYPQRQ